MKSTQILVIFTFASLSFAATDSGKCVQDDEAKEISQRWLNIFASGGSGGLAQAVTDNVCGLLTEAFLVGATLNPVGR